MMNGRVVNGVLSNFGPAETYTPLQPVLHRFNIYASSCVALVLSCRGDKPRELVTRFGIIQRENEEFGLVFGTFYLILFFFVLTLFF